MDYYQDSGHLFAKIFHSFDLPEFAKQGSYYDSLAEMPDVSFADPINRLFPVNDRANTYVSYAYAQAQKHNEKMAAVIETIEKAAAVFGIADSLPALADRVDNMLSKAASVEAEPEWKKKTAAFQIEFNTPTIAKIAGSGTEHAERAVCRFFEVLTQIPFDSRMKIASELIVAAEDNGVEIPEGLLKIAGKADCDYETYRMQALMRANMIPDISKKTAAVLASGITHPDEQLEALRKIDEEHKLASFYGRGILDPHRSVFNTIKKEARTLKVGSRTYPLDVWTGSGCNFEKAMQAAFGNEKTASLIVDGVPNLDSLTDSEAALLNVYLA